MRWVRRRVEGRIGGEVGGGGGGDRPWMGSGLTWFSQTTQSGPLSED